MKTINPSGLKTKYKYIHFVEAQGENKTVNGNPAYECKNNIDKSTLSIIFYYALWKEYCFTQAAGRVSERKIGVNVMLQVDVPNPEDGFSHSVVYSPSAIFSIQPTTEDWCRKFIKARVEYPVLPYVPNNTRLELKESENGEFEDDDNNSIYDSEGF